MLSKKISTFSEYITEVTALSPAQLNKRASSGPYEGDARIDILADLIKNKKPLETIDKKTVVVKDINAALKSIEQFKKDKKSFILTLDRGKTISTSKLAKSSDFGGGGGGAGGGTEQTAAVEAAQCVWIVAAYKLGPSASIDKYTEKVLTDAYKDVDTPSSLKDILSIPDTWRNSSYLIAQYVVQNRLLKKGLKYHRDSKTMQAIYALKNKAFKNSDMSKLMDDKWNPGDIWACAKDFKVSELNADTIADLNDDILDLYLQKRLVGISLKMHKGKGKPPVKEINVKRPPETEDHKFVDAIIKSPQRGEWYTTKTSFVLFDEGRLDIRAGSALGTIKAEIKGKHARGGGISWGPMVDAASRFYNKQLPDNGGLKKSAKLIQNGDEKETKSFIKILQSIDSSVSETAALELIEKLKVHKKGGESWFHSKLGSALIAQLVKKGGTKANKFITYCANYAGSATESSSAYIKIGK